VAGLSDFARRVLAAVRTHGWPAAGARWVVATSGGPDSTALAAALAELAAAGQLPAELCLAHFDHAIRPDSARDAEWVARLAGRLGAAFRTERGDVPALAARERLGLEAAARHARMAFLERAARGFGAAHIAAGHTADDQAETVLFRILRGTGLNGLAGIPAERPISPASPGILLVRPLLGLGRREVLGYLDERGLDYLTDPTNRDVAGQARARIRHELLPELEARYSPGVRAALVELARGAARVRESLGHAAAKLLEDAQLEPGEARLPLGTLALPAALRTEVFALAAERIGAPLPVGRGGLARAAEILARTPVGARAELRGLVAERGYDSVTLRRVGDMDRKPTAKPADRPVSPERGMERPSAGWTVPVAIPGETALPAGRLAARVVDRGGFDLEGFFREKSPLAEVFDARLLSPPAVLCRTRRPGDRFRPFGSAGEKKLKSFLIDRKLPRRERDAVPLLVLGDEILWVVGVRLSERSRVPADAGRLVVIEFVPEEPARG